MDEAFFICTANDIGNLPNFVLSRCTKVNIEVLSWEQRMKIAKMELDKSLKKYRLEIHRNKFSDNLLKKCLTEEWGIRGTKDNVQKIVQRFLSLGLNEEDEFDSKKTPADLNSYDWKLTNKKEYGHDCPAVEGQSHKQSCGCFFSEQVPGWMENMENLIQPQPIFQETEQLVQASSQQSSVQQTEKARQKRKSDQLQTQIQIPSKNCHLLRNGKRY